MEEPKLGFFQRIYHSIAGFGKYACFLRQNTGKAVLYLVILGLLFGVAKVVPQYIESKNWVDTFIKSFGTDVPDFAFENGKLDVKGKMPIVIKGEGPVIIIDTSGKTDETALDNYDRAILLTSDKMIQKNYANKQVIDLSMFSASRITKAEVMAVMPLMKFILVFSMFFGLLFFIAGKFLSALIISLAGLIINSAMNAGLKYRDIFVLTIYSMTLPMLLGAVFDLTLYTMPFFWNIFIFLFYAISIVYLWGAINSIKKDNRTDL